MCGQVSKVAELCDFRLMCDIRGAAGSEPSGLCLRLFHLDLLARVGGNTHSQYFFSVYMCPEVKVRTASIMLVQFVTFFSECYVHCAGRFCCLELCVHVCSQDFFSSSIWLNQLDIKR